MTCGITKLHTPAPIQIPCGPCSKKPCKPQCPCIKKIKEVADKVNSLNGDVSKNADTISKNHEYLLLQLTNLAEHHELDISELTDSDNQLLLNIDTLNDKVDVNEQDIESKIANEISRATDVESNLADSINAEEDRAALAEQLLDSKINNEITRATYEEGRLQDVIDALEAQHVSDIDTLNNTIDNRIDQLVNGAPAALDTLGEIVDLLRDDEDAVTALIATIAHETADRQTADSDLLTRLLAEITRSTTKDGEQDGTISLLATRLLNEIDRSITKDNSHDSSITTLTSNLAAEVTRSTTKDTEHDGDISTLLTNVTNLLSGKADKVAMATGTYTKVTVNGQGVVTAGANPTTLGGYGIADAYISNGTITLGNSTITPLTAHQDISGKADKSNTAAGTYTKVTVNNLGIVTNGENPNTLAGHGITDAYRKSEVDALILQLSNRIAALESDVAVLKTYWLPQVIAGENLLTTGYTINTLGYR